MSAPPPPLSRLRPLLLAGCIVVWACAFAATHTPPSMLPRLHVTDVALHAAGYFILASLLMGTLAAYRLAGARRAALALAILAAYGALDELTQPLVGRSAAWSDWFADMLGTAAAIAVWQAMLAFAARRRAPDR